MDGTPRTHFEILVYVGPTRPPEDATPMSLCPEFRTARVKLVHDVAQVTCRRCRHLLMIAGLTPPGPLLPVPSVGDDGVGV
jgi:hypothetical protein